MSPPDTTLTSLPHRVGRPGVYKEEKTRELPSFVRRLQIRIPFSTQEGANDSKTIDHPLPRFSDKTKIRHRSGKGLQTSVQTI